jgi:2-keto-4-pentenoate hydratase
MRFSTASATTRLAKGRQPVGRKIGFTNRTIWPRYGVDRPLWAHMWDQTMIDANDGHAALSCGRSCGGGSSPKSSSS